MPRLFLHLGKVGLMGQGVNACVAGIMISQAVTFPTAWLPQKDVALVPWIEMT
jgi:hypothetical protein